MCISSAAIDFCFALLFFKRARGRIGDVRLSAFLLYYFSLFLLLPLLFYLIVVFCKLVGRMNRGYKLGQLPGRFSFWGVSIAKIRGERRGVRVSDFGGSMRLPSVLFSFTCTCFRYILSVFSWSCKTLKKGTFGAVVAIEIGGYFLFLY